MSARRLEVDGAVYVVEPQAVRSSLSDGPTMLWGFEAHVFRDGGLVGIKTCFVGRAGVQFTAPEALDAPMAELSEVLYDRAMEKIAERLAAGEPGDEILFA